ncbi:MAG: AlwI family type II restriction endonuclease [Bacilli bacterium]|nr:AlwI family type II restriction endonuclease [Bacilli bacterium]
MGTSGNRPGFKIFSINTTVRNPNRNEKFLIAFKGFDGRIFTEEVFHSYLTRLVADGIYRFTRMQEGVRFKLEEGIELTGSEVEQLIRDNPQACGLNGRVMTQFRALKDQGFLMIEPVRHGLNKISITKLGWDLIGNEEYSTDVYCKAMIGMHANNPSRPANYNKARPFLNVLFVIDEVNKLWRALGRDNTGIAKHEFGAFVLSMKDCDYKKAAEEIIKYRKKFNFRINQKYLENYCYNELGLIPGKFDNITDEYPDDVFRKFEMTGLLTKRGRSTYTMYDFSSYNIEKVKSILVKYKDYSFKEFRNQTEYYRFLENIHLPWQESLDIRIEIAKRKASQLGVVIEDYSDIIAVEEYLDNEFYTNVLTQAIEEAEFNSLRKELMILSGRINSRSMYSDIDEPLRLEYVLALILGKSYGKVGLISNIIYNENGYPLHHAPSRRADLIYRYLNMSFIMEPTMLTSPTEMMTRETTGVREHYLTERARSNDDCMGMVISPFVSSRVASFFRYYADDQNENIIPVSIDAFVDMIDKSPRISAFKNQFDEYLRNLIQSTPEAYTDVVNSIKPSL